MLPWNYGFHLDAGHIVFLGAFYTVLVIIVTTLVNAALRSRRDLSSRKVERIRWHSEFHDLPAGDRVCRHVLTGEFESRECPHSFDCRECETHATPGGEPPGGRGRRRGDLRDVVPAGSPLPSRAHLGAPGERTAP